MKKSLITCGLIGCSVLSFGTSLSAADTMKHTSPMTSSSQAGVLVGGALMVPSMNIVENALNSKDHTILVAAVTAGKLADALQAEGPFTVFAPTNSAFAKLPAGTVETVLKPENLEMLQGILTYHVVPKVILASDLKDGMTVTTLQGDTLTFSYKNNMWYVNGALIEIADIISSNGVTHVINEVLMPPVGTGKDIKKSLEIRSMLSESFEQKVDTAVERFSLYTLNLKEARKMMLEKKLLELIEEKMEMVMSMGENGKNIALMLELLHLEITTQISLGVEVGGALMVPSMNIVENALNSKDHTTLVAAVTAGKLADALQAEGPFTVFAPTNSAFAKLPAGTVETVLKPENLEMLQGILTYHVVPKAILASDLKDGMTVTTLQGDTLTFSYKNNMWYVNGALIEIADIISSNGVTHVINEVLMPSK